MYVTFGSRTKVAFSRRRCFGTCFISAVHFLFGFVFCISDFGFCPLKWSRHRRLLARRIEECKICCFVRCHRWKILKTADLRSWITLLSCVFSSFFVKIGAARLSFFKALHCRAGPRSYVYLSLAYFNKIIYLSYHKKNFRFLFFIQKAKN